MWIYKGEEFTEDDVKDYVGFVYIITNKTNNKRYIGKKLFNFVRSKKVKNSTRRKRTKSQSDWMTYYGSNEQLKNDLKELGEINFTREILHLCKSKGTANYLEMKEQILHGVLESSDSFYNDWIICKVHKSHIKL